MRYTWSLSCVSVFLFILGEGSTLGGLVTHFTVFAICGDKCTGSCGPVWWPCQVSPFAVFSFIIYFPLLSSCVVLSVEGDGRCKLNVIIVITVLISFDDHRLDPIV